VVVNDQAVRACSTPLKAVAGKQVLTIEGLGAARLHAIQQAFLVHHAFQCGYCTPGMILTAYALLKKHPHPTREQIVAAMDDNLCRCGSHARVIAAIEQAAGKAGA
jgi:aerobic-type carbon monoxide dehydrogenase small subunit (CoxS/CutS family)